MLKLINTKKAIPHNTKVALVGESGSGKSLTAASIIGMLPSNAEIVEGKILMNGSNIVNLSEKEFQQIRGKEISIIFYYWSKCAASYSLCTYTKWNGGTWATL